MTALRATKLFPTEPDILPQLLSLAQQAVAEAEVLVAVLETNVEVASCVQGAREIEHIADDIVHNIARDLARSYNLDYSREDLHQLASALDDVIDFSHVAADRVLIYKFGQIPSPAVQLAKLIQRQAEELVQAVRSLNLREKALERCRSIQQLGEDADQVANSALGDLFARERDAITLIKVKDLYATLASAAHRAKTAAHAIEAMVMKGGPV